MSAGLEFDAELAQHTAVDVLPSGDAETKQGCDGMSEVRGPKSSGTRSFARRMLQASDLPWTRA